MTPIVLGPDASRYWLAAQGESVARPFHLRWLLPLACGTDPRRWWLVWGLSWPSVAGGVAVLTSHRGATGLQCIAAAVFAVALSGMWGPKVVRPVGVDLPALALGVWSAVAATAGLWWLAVPLALVAASVKESAPVWAALLAWHPLLLLGLAAVAVRALIARPVLDEVTARPDLRRIHEQPVRTALVARSWRDAWLMVAPWGMTLAALYRPSWQVLAVLAVAHLQLLVATDTVRLLHTAAGPTMAIAAALTIPPQWLPLALVAHVFWWRKPEVV